MCIRDRIYTGMDEDAKQGLCIGTESFWCVNSKVDEAKRQAAIEFLNWLTNEEKGKKEMVKLGFISPFKTFGEDEQPDDPLAKEVVRYMNDNGLETISWNFTSFPSQTFKEMCIRDSSSTEFRRKLGITDCSICSNLWRFLVYLYKATEERTEESSVHDF